MCVNNSCVINVFFSSMTMASKKGYNIARYTSGFTHVSTMPPPTDKQLKDMEYMMEDLKPTSKKVEELKRKVEVLLPKRGITLKLFEQAIKDLKKHHFNVNIAKVNLYIS